MTGAEADDAAVSLQRDCDTCRNFDMKGRSRTELPPEWEAYRTSDAPPCPDAYSDAGPLYHVYVIELDDEAGTRLDPRKPIVYVGESARCPYVRFIQHLIGRFPRRTIAERHGVRLKPRLYRNFGPYLTRAESKAAEGRLANRLRRQGYKVFGGH